MSTEKKLQHIAMIMDGNRRWAVERGMPKLMGHTEGAKALKKIARAVKDKGIPYLTVWALSTENLKNRSEKELEHLFSLFNRLTDYLGDFEKDNVRCNIIGDLSKLPKKTQEKLQELLDKTKDNTALTLTLAINYGGRDEILRAIQKIKAGDNVTEENFTTYLDTHDLPEPNLIIRTGGHQRLSGFLPWQCTYSELYFTNTFWPAFNEAELDKALDWYNEQQQNRGK